LALQTGLKHVFSKFIKRLHFLTVEDGANCVMASIARATAAIATILAREGIDYAQSKAVFKAARQRAGLRAPTERRGGVDRLTVEEELRFLDQAYGQDGRTA
jgi:hypothetical protein